MSTTKLVIMQRTAIANSLSKQCRDKIAKGKEAD